ncbi:glycoside hydrolase family 26 protein [Mucilaginibacter dorajii]|uniref:Mannan endo-1,4-beta-mannosidase n=1 Tax=Mucilaginibacter dorajii TaxID=692994 RepID=A0ABP7P0C8_9SPHI|nr:glycoside hydrolase family 26 protein [Mucilaginibacter dorajii]MCS3735590.1 mannan endo-1,4-beta-mannosidase [Mucilaginibacter dorajii]
MSKYAIAFVLMISGLTTKAQLYAPADKMATPETRALYYSMQRLVGAGVLFGHHDDTAYGVGWRYDADRSDVKSVTGSYPAIYGWDLAKIEHDSIHDINSIPFQLQKQLVKDAYNRGGINTFCWHMDNPANGKTAWDTTKNTPKTLVAGGAYHDAYITYLDRAAAYLKELKGPDGEAIPILFRPFHELTGSWFWWGKKQNTPDELIALWQFTVDYLRNTKKLHNLLIVYSVADFDSEAEFMERYPGDDYVDFIGFDNYCTQSVNVYQTRLDKRLSIIDAIATSHHKRACLPETGYVEIPQPDWWTSVLLPTLSRHKISYVMAWRNGNDHHYYVPYPGQASADDFVKFFNSGQTMFQNRLTGLGVYGKPVFSIK